MLRTNGDSRPLEIIQTRAIDEHDEKARPPLEVDPSRPPKDPDLKQLRFGLEQGTFAHGVALADPQLRREHDRALGEAHLRDIAGPDAKAHKILYTADNGESRWVAPEQEDLLRALQEHRFNQVREIQSQAPHILDRYEQIRAIMDGCPVYFTPNAGALAWRIVSRWGGNLAPVTHTAFATREHEFEIDDVAGKTPFIVTSSWGDPSEALIQSAQIARAMRRNRSLPPILIAPYIGWARQDREGVKRTHLSLPVIGRILEGSGMERILTQELHTEQAAGMFGNFEVTHLRASAAVFKALDDLLGHSPKVREKLVVVTPDIGGIPRARYLANYLKVKYYPIDKTKDPITRDIETELLKAIPQGAIAVSYDDLTDTGSTICSNARLAKEAGASVFIAVLAHGPLGKDLDRLQNDPNIDYVIVTDSIGNADVHLYHPTINPKGKFIVPSVSGLFAQAMLQLANTGQVAPRGSIHRLAKDVIENDPFLYVNGKPPPCLSETA